MGLLALCEVARRPENKAKNRYGNIVACKFMRMSADCVSSDYLQHRCVRAEMQWWREKKQHRGHESLNDSVSAKGKMKMKLCCAHITQYMYIYLLVIWNACCVQESMTHKI